MTAFLESFFPIEKREAKVEEFINLHQGCMSVKKYSLKFVKLSKYASSQVSNSRDEMSRFVTIVSKDFVRRNVRNSCCMITWTLLGLWYMHSSLRRVVRERETERVRNLGPQISLVQAMVIIHLEFGICPSSRRATSTQVILLPIKTLIPRREMIEMPSVIESHVVSMSVCMEVRSW